MQTANDLTPVDPPAIPWAGLNAYSMLVPEPWDSAWTRLDAIFNAYATSFASDEQIAAGVTPDGQAIVAELNDFRRVTTNSVPITQSTLSNIALLNQNTKRKLLLIQNNSTATSPDVAPTFYIGFGQTAQVGLGLGLAPGVGVVLDVSCPSDAIYVTLGPSTNTGGTVVIQGVAVEGVTPGN